MASFWKTLYSCSRYHKYLSGPNKYGEGRRRGAFHIQWYPTRHPVSEDDSSLDRSFESCTNAYDFCVHFINKQDDTVDSQFVNAEDNLTLDEVMTILQDKLKRAMNDLVFKGSLEGEPLPSTTTLSEFVTSPDADLYVYYGTGLTTQRASSPLLRRWRKR